MQARDFGLLDRLGMVHSFGNPYYLLLIAAATEIRQALGRGMGPDSA